MDSKRLLCLADKTGGGVDVVYDPVGMIVPSLKVSRWFSVLDESVLTFVISSSIGTEGSSS